jgi:hypothetical protein
MRNRTAVRRIVTIAIGALVAVVLLTAGTFGVAGAAGKDLKVFKGRWTCPICEAKGLKGEKAECEDLGHKHALRLDDGTIITFVENERSEALVKGGDRHWLRIEVCGLYDPAAKALDVDSYQIDGIWTTWCDVHDRMDMCRSGASGQVNEGTKKDGQ